MTRTFILNIAALIVIPLTAKAELLTGVMNISGTVNVLSGSIQFGDGGTYTISSPADEQQGTFNTLAGTTGEIMSLTTPPGSMNVPDFMTANAAPNISFTLTLLDSGIEGSAGCSATPAAGGQVCTPASGVLSALDFQNTSATTGTATFNISGVEVDSLTGNTIAIDGVFTLPLNESFQTLLATLGSGGISISAFSASLATESNPPPPPPPSVPEPATWASVAIGTAGILLLGGRSTSRKMGTTISRP